MKAIFDRTTLTVIREEGDPRMKNESVFLHHLKKHLNSKGCEFIKKRMWKDGHMVDETQQYLRNGKCLQDATMAIWSGFYAIRDASVDFNEGQVTLQCERWED
jgi:hypothetical protein